MNQKKTALSISTIGALLLIAFAFQNCKLSATNETNKNQNEQSRPSLDAGSGSGNGDGYNGATNNRERRDETFGQLENYDLYWISPGENCQSAAGPSPVKGILQIDKDTITYFEGCDKTATQGVVIGDEEILFGGDERILGLRRTESNFEFKDTFPTNANTTEYIEGACYQYVDFLPFYDNGNYPQRELSDFRTTVYREIGSDTRRATATHFYFDYTQDVIDFLDGKTNVEPPFTGSLENYNHALTTEIFPQFNEINYVGQGNLTYDLFVEYQNGDSAVFADIKMDVERQPTAEETYFFDTQVRDYDENTCFFNVIE